MNIRTSAIAATTVLSMLMPVAPAFAQANCQAERNAVQAAVNNWFSTASAATNARNAYEAHMASVRSKATQLEAALNALRAAANQAQRDAALDIVNARFSEFNTLLSQANPLREASATAEGNNFGASIHLQLAIRALRACLNQ